MEFIKMMSEIEVCIQEDVIDHLDITSVEEYELVNSAYDLIMAEIDRQMFVIAQKNGFGGDINDFKLELLNARVN